EDLGVGRAVERKREAQRYPLRIIVGQVEARAAVRLERQIDSGDGVAVLRCREAERRALEVHRVAHQGEVALVPEHGDLTHVGRPEREASGGSAGTAEALAVRPDGVPGAVAALGAPGVGTRAQGSRHRVGCDHEGGESESEGRSAHRWLLCRGESSPTRRSLSKGCSRMSPSKDWKLREGETVPETPLEDNVV